MSLPAIRRSSLPCLLALLICSTRALAEDPLFDAPYLEVAALAADGVLVDLNHDGHLDLVTNSGAHLGAGDGTFPTFIQHEYPSTPGLAGVGDVNGDGKLDVVVPNYGDAVNTGHTVAVLLGNGDGTFGPMREFEAGNSPNDVAVADLNADGRADVITSNSGRYQAGAGNVSVLLANADGTLQPKVDYSTAEGPGDVAIADFNSDGKPDLVVGGFGTNTTPGNTVIILLGNGDGTFEGDPAFVVGDRPGTIAVGDLNADGRLDLAVASASATVLLGNGDATFTRKDLGVFAADFEIVDLDRDGKLDLVTYNGYLPGDGAGNFGPLRTPFQRLSYLHVFVADFNEDGLVDVAAGTALSFAHADGTFGSTAITFPVPVLYDHTPRSLGAGDFDGDEDLDLVIPGYEEPGRLGFLSLLLGTGDGRFVEGTAVTDVGYLSSLAVGDVNVDGKADVVGAGFNQAGLGALWVRLGKGDGTFDAVTPLPIGNENDQFKAVRIGELNGDGKPDLVVTGEFSSAVWTLLGNGNGLFEPAVMRESTGRAWALALGDVTGDGKTDAVTANDGPRAIVVYPGNGDGTLGPGVSYPVNDLKQAVLVTHLDGDANLDVVAAGQNLVTVLRGGGANGLEPAKDYFAQGGTAGDPPVQMIDVADLNGDGLKDIAVASRALNVVFGQQDGSFLEGGFIYGGPGGLAVHIADLNADAQPDVVTMGQVFLHVGGAAGNGAPDLTQAAASPSQLSQRNGRFVPIQVGGVTDPDGDAVTIRVTRVTQDEPLGQGSSKGRGGSGECADAVIDEDGSVSLRAERSGSGNGRVYTIWFTATDASGAASEGSVQVCVPHDAHDDSCEDDGQDYNSLGPCPRVAQRAAAIPDRLELAAGPRSGDVFTLEYALPEASEVTIAVFDLAGRKLETLERGSREAGFHQTRWNAASVPSGVYFYGFQAGAERMTKRVLVVR